MPALVGETIPGIRISDYPRGWRTVRDGTRPYTPRHAPTSGGPAGRFSRRHGPKRTPAREGGPEGSRGSLSGHRERQHAHGPHRHTGDRDSDCLLPHGFHPIFGLMLSGTLDQHNTARSDGRHRRYFSRHGAKYKMPRTGGAGGNSCLRVHSTARRKGHPDPRQKVSGLSAGRRAAPSPGPCTRFPPSTRRGGRRSPVRRAPGARPESSRWFFRSCRPGFSCSKPAPDTGPRP